MVRWLTTPVAGTVADGRELGEGRLAIGLVHTFVKSEKRTRFQ